jgi:hypothetical protein
MPPAGSPSGTQVAARRLRRGRRERHGRSVSPPWRCWRSGAWRACGARPLTSRVARPLRRDVLCECVTVHSRRVAPCLGRPASGCGDVAAMLRRECAAGGGGAALAAAQSGARRRPQSTTPPEPRVERGSFCRLRARACKRGVGNKGIMPISHCWRGPERSPCSPQHTHKPRARSAAQGTPQHAPAPPRRPTQHARESVIAGSGPRNDAPPAAHRTRPALDRARGARGRDAHRPG